jgi:hypothetical protein
MIVACIWKQSVGAAIFISESWATVDGLQKSDVLHNKHYNWKESIEAG